MTDNNKPELGTETSYVTLDNATRCAGSETPKTLGYAEGAYRRDNNEKLSKVREALAGFEFDAGSFFRSGAQYGLGSYRLTKTSVDKLARAAVDALEEN